MERSWTPEVVVDEARARSLLGRVDRSLAHDTITRFGQGWDNVAYRVGPSLIVRFPQRAIAGDLMRHEVVALPVIAAHVPCSVPQPVIVGGPFDDYPFVFAGYHALPGTPLDVAASARPAEEGGGVPRQTLARDLARFLRALHQTPVPAALPTDSLRRLDVPYRVDLTRRRLRDLTSARLLAPHPREHHGALEQILDEAPRSYEPRAQTLVHGALYARHLLVEGDSALIGVIDWGDVHRGDPAVDLAVVAGALPPDTHPDFFDIYGATDTARWAVARLRALHHATALLAYGHDIQDEAMVAEARRSLHFLAASS